MKRFVAFVNDCRKYIKKLAHTAHPFNYLTRKGAPFNWTEEFQCAFDSLKPLFYNSTSFNIQIFHFHSENISGCAVGTILSNSNRTIAFASRLLNKAKTYCAIEQELLAIRL